MKIEFSKNISRVRDAMDGLVQAYKDNYKSLYQEYDLEPSEVSEEALRFIAERIKYDIPYSDLFFGRKTGIANAFANSRFVPTELTIDSFADHLRSLSDEEIKQIVLSDLKIAGDELSYEEICRISQDESKILDFLRRLELPSSTKWEALEFFSDVKSSMKGFIDLVDDYIPAYKEIIEKNRQLIEDFDNYVATGIEAEGKAFFAKLSNDSVSLDSGQVIAGTLFFNSNSLIFITVGDKLYAFIGRDYEETLKQATGAGDLDFVIGIYKNLSDKTRFQILNLLKDNELYGQEIAEKVGITMATVSYHMSYLMGSNLVKLEKVGQKGYYTLRKDTLRKSIEYLNHNFKL